MNQKVNLSSQPIFHHYFYGLTDNVFPRNITFWLLFDYFFCYLFAKIPKIPSSRKIKALHINNFKKFIYSISLLFTPYTLVWGDFFANQII